MLVTAEATTRAALRALLASDLSFQGHDTSAWSHDFHAFPAKFPPPLPRAFINALTAPGERVLDPMMGSGTCVVEAMAAGRVGLGCDIDPLALLLGRVKTTPADAAEIAAAGLEIVGRAEHNLTKKPGALADQLAQRFEPKTARFVENWFGPQTQLELFALVREIERVKDAAAQDFLRLVFSSVIITKTGGVSLAWDLAHTRPHKLMRGMGKPYKPALREFRRRLEKNLAGLAGVNSLPGRAEVKFGNAEAMPLPDESVDLLFTSPPYAANAIDYMRAHKFALVWFGRGVNELAAMRGRCIGGESLDGFNFAELPRETAAIVQRISALDAKRGAALRRYYSEMARVVGQSFRVLKPGRAAVFVVGSAVMRGTDTHAAECLGEIGAACGFELIGIATRKLDRDRRLMPARNNSANRSIEARMHEEYVVALVKPAVEIKQDTPAEGDSER
jgi:DNA modification methylase